MRSWASRLFARSSLKFQMCPLHPPPPPNSSFKNIQSLDKHFDTDHFPCTNAECLAKKFVVFSSEMDLRAHQVHEVCEYSPLSLHPSLTASSSQHGSTMSARDLALARRIEVSMNFDEPVVDSGFPSISGGRRGGGRGGASSVRGGSRGGAAAGPSRGRAAPPHLSGGSGGAEGMLSNARNAQADARDHAAAVGGSRRAHFGGALSSTADGRENGAPAAAAGDQSVIPNEAEDDRDRETTA